MVHHVITTSGTYYVSDGDTVEINGPFASIRLVQDPADTADFAEVDITITGSNTSTSVGTLDIDDTLSADLTVADGVDLSNTTIAFDTPGPSNIFATEPVTHHDIHISDDASLRLITFQNASNTHITMTTGDNVTLGTPGSTTTTILSELDARNHNSLSVTLGENNTVHGRVALSQVQSIDLDVSDATLLGPGNLNLGTGTGTQADADSATIVAENVTTGNINRIIASARAGDDVTITGLTHNVIGASPAGTVDAPFGSIQLLQGDDTLHLGGDLVTNDARYQILGGTGNDHLDFQFVNEAQKQAFINAFTAAGGTYDPLTDTFGNATGRTWSIPQEDGTGVIEFSQFETVGISPLCFLRGTLIATMRGQVAVEDLRVGDMVQTMDHGFQPIRWIGARNLSASELAGNPKMKPVRIKVGSLGSGLPHRDLVVSPQHRMLVRSKIAERMFDVGEVLIPAIKLCEIDGVDVLEDATNVAYFHILFDQHQVIYAESAPSESLFTGPEAMKTLSTEAREEILTLFPELAETEHEPVPARLIPAGKLQKQLIKRHAKNDRSLLAEYQDAR